MIRPPENRNPGIAQLFEIGNDRVHLRFPLPVEAGSFGGQFVPYQLRRPTLPGPDRRTVAVVALRGETAVPHQGNDPPLGMARFDLFDQSLPQFFGRFTVRKALAPGRSEVHRSAVVVVADIFTPGIETEVAAPNHGAFARHFEDYAVIAGGIADKVMLPGEGVSSPDRVEEFEQLARFR